MANDRMVIICTACNEAIYLAKRMGMEWYSLAEPDQFVDCLNDFFEKHLFCNEADVSGMSFTESEEATYNHFKIGFENTDQFTHFDWEKFKLKHEDA